MIRENIDWKLVYAQFRTSTPFNHVVIDDFFLPEIAEQLSNEFPDFNDPILGHYDSPLERKKCCNQWDKFPLTTYQAFTFMNREAFLNHMRELVGNNNLWMDIGLNGGGWHMHGSSGNLNIHLDYNVHPKLNEQRKLNIIVYLTKDWNNDWGGGLELWSHDDVTNQPKELIKTIDNVYNRAIIFDTTQNSWHGLPKQLTCPEETYRKSLAAYYVRPALANIDPRGKALFAPREDQKNDESIRELIRKRANISSAENVWKS